MAKCHRNSVGSVVLDSRSGGNFKIWPTFSGASFRRKIIDSMRCGGGSRHRQVEETAKSPIEMPKLKPPTQKSECRVELKRVGGSEKLSELLKLSESPESEEEVKRKVEVLEVMKRVVKNLQGEKEELLSGAIEVRRLTKEDAEARTTLALLGAIPPLVALLDSPDSESQIAALYALLNIGIGNDANKAAIVKAGAIHKMLKLVESPLQKSPNYPSISEGIVANFLALSALDLNKPIIGSSGAIKFLVKTLKNPNAKINSQAKQDSARALYNLSISPSNISPILETDLVQHLIATLGDDMAYSERYLAILSNLISSPEGRKTITAITDALPILIDVLNWTDSPGCQEKATYILMVVTHKGYGDRQSMIDHGIVSSLLELTLLGTTLAQKRASRILELFRVNKGKQVSAHFGNGLGSNVSAPICGEGGSSGSSVAPDHHRMRECLDDDEEEEDGTMMSEEKKAVKQLVQQSLQSNMRRIVKRANLPQDFAPSEHFKSLTLCSTSKSLPF